MRCIDASSRRKREPLRLCVSQVVRPSNQVGVMDLELFAFVFCVKNLCPYLFGKLFTVRTDHKNLVYLVLCSQTGQMSIFDNVDLQTLASPSASRNVFDQKSILGQDHSPMHKFWNR